jgi:hypothetical protein
LWFPKLLKLNLQLILVNTLPVLIAMNPVDFAACVVAQVMMLLNAQHNALVE